MATYIPPVSPEEFKELKAEVEKLKTVVEGLVIGYTFVLQSVTELKTKQPIFAASSDPLGRLGVFGSADTASSQPTTEFHTSEVPATLPPNSGNVLRVLSNDTVNSEGYGFVSGDSGETQ